MFAHNPWAVKTTQPCIPKHPQEKVTRQLIWKWKEVKPNLTPNTKRPMLYQPVNRHFCSGTTWAIMYQQANQTLKVLMVKLLLLNRPQPVSKKLGCQKRHFSKRTSKFLSKSWLIHSAVSNLARQLRSWDRAAVERHPFSNYFPRESRRQEAHSNKVQLWLINDRSRKSASLAKKARSYSKIMFCSIPLLRLSCLDLHVRLD